MRISDWSSDVCSSDLQRGHRFQTAIGRAGAGKTTTIAACADAWAAAGYRVVGAAVKGEATRTLAAATGIECETVRSEERRVGKECVSTCRARWSQTQ